MRQSKELKQRTCRHCLERFETDAKGIKAHAEECQKGKAKNEKAA
jgi:hypothetical protein